VQKGKPKSKLKNNKQIQKSKFKSQKYKSKLKSKAKKLLTFVRQLADCLLNYFHSFIRVSSISYSCQFAFFKQFN